MSDDAVIQRTWLGWMEHPALLVVFNYIYAVPTFLTLYRALKRILRLVGFSSEIARICGTAASQSPVAGLKTPLASPLDEANDVTVVLPPYLKYRFGRCLLFSKALAMQRRQLEIQGTSAVAAVYPHIALDKGVSPTTLNGHVLHACLQAYAGIHELRVELEGLAATAYDSSDKEHEAALLELWACLCPDEPLTGRISEQWKSIGFQGTNPATDFRSMGVLGLQQLLYFARRHPETAAEVLADSHRPESWYSMAIVGIHLTAYCLQLLRLRQLDMYLYIHGAKASSFHALYTYVFASFNLFWNNRPTPAPIMQFERLFDEFASQMETELKLRPHWMVWELSNKKLA